MRGLTTWKESPSFQRSAFQQQQEREEETDGRVPILTVSGAAGAKAIS